MRTLFLRCQWGHLFRQGACGYDGWDYPGQVEAERLFAQNPNMTHADLIAAGVPPETVRRVVIIECDEMSPAVEALNISACYLAGHDGEQPSGRAWVKDPRG